jgi:hypothetical protein
MSNQKRYMTVREMVKQLQTFNPDECVWITTHSNEDDIGETRGGTVYKMFKISNIAGGAEIEVELRKD